MGMFKKQKEREAASKKTDELLAECNKVSGIAIASRLAFIKSMGSDLEEEKRKQAELDMTAAVVAADVLSIHTANTIHLFPLTNHDILKKSKTIRTADEALLEINRYTAIAAKASEAFNNARADQEQNINMEELMEALTLDPGSLKGTLGPKFRESYDTFNKLRDALRDVDEITAATKHLF
jgi:hypothetical protein